MGLKLYREVDGFEDSNALYVRLTDGLSMVLIRVCFDRSLNV